MPNQSFDFESGDIILVDKPLEWTSFDVVKKVRFAGRFKKVGHAGTLDPLATGLLVLCTEKKTKQISQIQDASKVYEATVRLGATTPTLDAESEVVEGDLPSDITEEAIKNAAARMVGPYMQIPPIHSAILIDGKRAYESARKGQEVEMKARPITFHEIEVMEVSLPLVRIRIHCSKGTYIRSFARDFAKELGTTGYLTQLRRTRIGELDVADSWEISQLAARLAEERRKLADRPEKA